MFKFALSQESNSIPYSFKSTGINIYSFEELLYHVYHYWRESIDEFLSNDTIKWVAEIGHSTFSADMKELRGDLAEKLLGFLALGNYFDESDILALKPQLQKWQERREWERLKERADYFVKKGEPEKSFSLYRQALAYDENPQVLNNLGVALMQSNRPDEAAMHLKKAADIDSAFMENYIEAVILSGDYSTAEALLQGTDFEFLRGLLAHEKKEYQQALHHYQLASNSICIYKIADVYIALRNYSKALDVLSKISVRKAEYYVKEADVYAAWNDPKKAAASIKRAIDISPSPGLYARLAKYLRLDYDLKAAEDVLASVSESNDDMVKLEYARLRKAQGKLPEYQAALDELLLALKKRYRENGITPQSF